MDAHVLPACTNGIKRDHAQEMADQLAQMIADFAGVDIGEHSNANCPWENALEIDLASRRLIGRGWMPIETLEGLPVVLVSRPSTSKEIFKPTTSFKDVTGVWRVFRSEGGMEPLPFEPTHWQPLPAPPHTEERG